MRFYDPRGGAGLPAAAGWEAGYGAGECQGAMCPRSAPPAADGALPAVSEH